MIQLRRILVIGLIFIGVGAVGAEAECPDIKKLREFYREKQFITLNFLQVTHSEIFETVDSLGGKLWAGREGRFRLVMPGQVLVSDGILYWSFSQENNQVLVDSVARLGDWNPLVLVYDPQKVYDCRGQEKSGKTIEFDMVGIDSMTVPEEFLMQVGRQGYIPQKITYFDDNDSKIEVFLEGFSRSAELPDSLFIFKADAGVEIIELP